MHFKILHIVAVALLVTKKINAQNVNYNGYLPTNYGIGDSASAASQFYNQIYTPRQQTGLTQYHELPSISQDTSYTEYLAPPAHTFQPSYRLAHRPPQHPLIKLYPNPSETVITPVQHSTVIHHAPYLHSINGQNPPFVGKLVYLNGKPSQINTQPLKPSSPLQPHQYHPLQKPLHYQQQPQKFHPSQQVNPPSQTAFLPIRHPQPIRQAPPQHQNDNSNNKENTEENDERESEAIEEEDNLDDEEKGDLNEENEDDDGSTEEVGRYRDEKEAEEDEEEPSKYTNYSFETNSSGNKQTPRNKNNADDEDEDDHRGGYRTHEDVEENDEEDNDDDGTRNKYVKKVPKGFALNKYGKQPIVNKFTVNPPTKSSKFDYTTVTFTTPRPIPKHKTSEQRDKRYKTGDSQSKPSEVVPVITKHMYREKWYLLQKS